MRYLDLTLRLTDVLASDRRGDVARAEAVIRLRNRAMGDVSRMATEIAAPGGYTWTSAAFDCGLPDKVELVTVVRFDMGP